VRYASLYADIGRVFKLAIQPMLENVLGYKLNSREKVIVKAMRYVLQKSGDKFEGSEHREGMGENIAAVAIYYPQISSSDDGMYGGDLRLKIPKQRYGDPRPSHEFKIKEGSAVAFLNDGVHSVPHMIYRKDGAEEKGPLTRTVLAQEARDDGCPEGEGW